MAWSLSNHKREVLLGEIVKTEYRWDWEGNPRVLHEIEVLVAIQVEVQSMWWVYLPRINRQARFREIDFGI